MAFPFKLLLRIPFFTQLKVNALVTLNKVKIDRSYLWEIEGDPRSLSLLRGIARLAADLGMTVTAEGIETDVRLALVVATPCIEKAQGLLFSPPMSGHDMSVG